METVLIQKTLENVRLVMITAKLQDDCDININRIVIEGYSQWTIVRRVTSKSDIIYSNENYLQLPNHAQIPITDVDFHSFLPYSIFLRENQQNCSTFQAKLICATRNISTPENKNPWKHIEKIIDKVYRHVCGHSALGNIEILLKQNNLRNNEVQNYLNRTLSSCVERAKLTCANKRANYPLAH